MHDLNYDLKRLCQRNPDGGFSTRATRERVLRLMGDQLRSLGFKQMSATSLKPKHVEALLAHWRAENLSTGTIKNRMAHLRWWAEKIDKQNVIARENQHYGIPERSTVASESRARSLSAGDLAKVSDPYTRISLRLQAAFGLRREESIKLRPALADQGDRLRLLPSWTKGGRAREIPIRTAEQRLVLADALALAGQGGLLPPERNYVQQLRRFEHQCAAASIHRVHGHRHEYAQRRYQELNGWASPAAGGPRSAELTPEQKDLDRDARLVVSSELGHSRETVTTVYLGR